MEKIKSYQEDSEVQKNRWWILVSVAKIGRAHV